MDAGPTAAVAIGLAILYVGMLAALGAGLVVLRRGEERQRDEERREPAPREPDREHRLAA